MYVVCMTACTYVSVWYDGYVFVAGAALNFFTITTNTTNVACSSAVEITITPESSESSSSTFIVTLNIEQLSNCGTGVSSNVTQQSK